MRNRNGFKTCVAAVIGAGSLASHGRAFGAKRHHRRPLRRLVHGQDDLRDRPVG
jgi:hypothetical protein